MGSAFLGTIKASLIKATLGEKKPRGLAADFVEIANFDSLARTRNRGVLERHEVVSLLGVSS